MPRKQGRRPGGTDFVHFGVELLFARELRACLNEFIVLIPNEKEREITMRIFFVAVLNLSNGDMHNFLETRSENWHGF